MDEIHVCVGSLNPTKINAVHKGFKKYFERTKYFEVKVDSKISNQPIGLDIIIEGATNRAKGALFYLNNEKKIYHKTFGVGIEAGLVKIPFTNSGYMDFQFCVIIDEFEKISIGSGVAFEYPQFVINQILTHKNEEVGDIIGELANNMNLKNESGAISYLSKNAITRTDILTQAVICALLPRINKKLYSRALD